MERNCLICRTDITGSRSDARFCSARCRKRYHRQPVDMRVDYVADPWLPPSDEQIEHERSLLVTARFQTRTCSCESPFQIADDDDGHIYCLKCAWPIASGHSRLHGLLRLIARLARYPRGAEALRPQPA
jgi:hypothetical protein